MAVLPTISESSAHVFTRSEAFWNNYLNGRPAAPEVFFDRLFRYHRERSGRFGTVHDAGAGNGPYSAKLLSRFEHVIVSDIGSDNVAFAKDRLGMDGFSYRIARIEDGDDIQDGSIDMVFATNVMHFPDQELAMSAVAKQLRPGGTFACATFGAAHFEDAKVQGIYVRIGQAGARILLKTLEDPEKLIAAMARTRGHCNMAPLDEDLFEHGAQRILLNMPEAGMTSPLPPEVEVEEEPLYDGANDVVVREAEDGWSFVMDLYGIQEHIQSFPFGQEVETVLPDLWQELKEAVKDREVNGYWPAKIILATRRSPG